MRKGAYRKKGGCGNDNKLVGKSKKNYTVYNDQYHPTAIINISNSGNRSKTIHPTQKPVALFEYLIRTYTNKNDLVLDFTIGSGTTAIAALKTDRRYIGIERDPEYYKVACQRVVDHELQLTFDFFKRGKNKS